MTVREAFVKAYGPIPEGAPTGVVVCQHTILGLRSGPIYVPFARIPTVNGMSQRVIGRKCGWAHDSIKDHEFVEHWPDISDRPAHAFLGFFGEEYDKVVKGEDK